MNRKGYCVAGAEVVAAAGAIPVVGVDVEGAVAAEGAVAMGAPAGAVPIAPREDAGTG
jgi:hypothetical protein